MQSFDISQQINLLSGPEWLYINMQNVMLQGKSPRINGQLVLRANVLNVARYIERHQIMVIPGYGPHFTTKRFSGAMPDYSHPFWVSCEEQLVAECQNKFLERTSSLRVNLLDLYRTRLEAANMVSTMANRLAEAYSHLKKGRIKRFCRTLGISYKKPKRKSLTPPELWLEYNYGWAPLLSDLYTMLDNTFEVPSAHVRQVVRMSWPGVVSSMPEYGNVRTHAEFLLTGRATAQSTVFVDVPAVQAASQYGVTNPLAVAWEALPFSFVVDWFLPVGDFINSLNTTSGIKFKNYSLTSKMTCEGTVTAWYKFSYWDPWSSAGSGTAKMLRYNKKRQLNDNPVWTWPGINNPMDQSVQRVSYALSLLASVFSNRR